MTVSACIVSHGEVRVRHTAVYPWSAARNFGQANGELTQNRVVHPQLNLGLQSLLIATLFNLLSGKAMQHCRYLMSRRSATSTSGAAVSCSTNWETVAVHTTSSVATCSNSAAFAGTALRMRGGHVYACMLSSNRGHPFTHDETLSCAILTKFVDLGSLSLCRDGRLCAFQTWCSRKLRLFFSDVRQRRRGSYIDP